MKKKNKKKKNAMITMMRWLKFIHPPPPPRVAIVNSLVSLQPYSMDRSCLDFLGKVSILLQYSKDRRTPKEQ